MSQFFFISNFGIISAYSKEDNDVEDCYKFLNLEKQVWKEDGDIVRLYDIVVIKLLCKSYIGCPSFS